MAPDGRRGLFVGLSTLDVVQLVERTPGRNEKVPALDLVVAAGGPAANAAVVFAALGGRARLVTRISHDAVGDLVRADLAACGVEVVNTARADEPTTAVASILITRQSGERAVVSAADHGRSSRADLSVALGRAQGSSAQDRIDVMLMDSYETDLSAPLAAAARAAGVPVLLDVGAKKPWTADQLAQVDCAVVSEDYRPGGAPVIARDLADDGVRWGVATAGAGPVGWWAGDPARVERTAVPVVACVDTLGAGDFFHGALAYALAGSGLTPSGLDSGVAFAVQVASASVQSFGPRAWLKNLRR